MDHNRQSDLHRAITTLRRKIGGGTKSERAGERESGRAGEKRRLSVFATLRLLPSFSLVPSLSRSLALSLSLCLAGCSRPAPEVEKRAAVDEFFARARSCWPSNGRNGEDNGSLKLAVESVARAENATLVRLIAYARDQAVDFYLPIYRLSAGQWLINEKGRAYLLNEQCREFKLNDSKPSSISASIFWGGGQIPQGGRIRLNPGQVFEATLSFPQLPDQTRIGALVYDGSVLPFTVLTDPQSR